MATNKLTFKAAKAACNALGFTLTSRPHSSEYRLAIAGMAYPESEASACYTNDLSDALGTARLWFERRSHS